VGDAGAVSERGPPCGGVSSTSDPRSDVLSGSQDGQSILLQWLTLLGWQVDATRDRDRFVGVARHTAADGSSARVKASAATRDELAFRLFDAVMKIVEARRHRPEHPPLAA